MARDILLGKTSRNWARGHLPQGILPAPSPTTDEVSKLSPAETEMLASLAALKVRADAGDRRAQKEMLKKVRGVANLRSKAKRGDAVAQRTLTVLRESGVFEKTTAFSMGDEATTVPNSAYRLAVYQRAQKRARVGGRTSPTTRDFFRAKREVDRTMAGAGISLFLPGAKPGRVTA